MIHNSQFLQISVQHKISLSKSVNEEQRLDSNFSGCMQFVEISGREIERLQYSYIKNTLSSALPGLYKKSRYLAVSISECETAFVPLSSSSHMDCIWDDKCTNLPTASRSVWAFRARSRKPRMMTPGSVQLSVTVRTTWQHWQTSHLVFHLFRTNAIIYCG